MNRYFGMICSTLRLHLGSRRTRRCFQSPDIQTKLKKRWWVNSSVSTLYLLGSRLKCAPATQTCLPPNKVCLCATIELNRTLVFRQILAGGLKIRLSAHTRWSFPSLAYEPLRDQYWSRHPPPPSTSPIRLSPPLILFPHHRCHYPA